MHCRQYFGLEGTCSSRFTVRDSCLVLWFHGVKQKQCNPERFSASVNYPNPSAVSPLQFSQHYNSPGLHCRSCQVKPALLPKRLQTYIKAFIYSVMQHDPTDLCLQTRSWGFTTASSLTQANPPIKEQPTSSASPPSLVSSLNWHLVVPSENQSC